MPRRVRELFTSTLRSNSIFIGFTDEQMNETLDSLFLKEIQPNQQVIQQNVVGDKMYFVESGACKSTVGELIYRAGDLFGELALMYNSPRNSTVIAIEQTRLWALDRTTYRRIVASGGGDASSSNLQWEAVERAFYAHAGDDRRLTVDELRGMLMELFGIELNHRDSTGQSVLDMMLDALDGDASGDVDIDELSAAWRTWFGGAIRPVRCLVIIDVQNDFIDGTLALKNCPAGEDGAVVVPVINQMRAEYEFDYTAISLDWHPERHCSFWECARAGDFPAPLHPSQDAARVREAELFDDVTLTAPDGKSPMKQTLWPRHCVRNTWGAACHKDLVVREGDIIVHKGTDPGIDSYSCVFDNGKYKDTGLLEKLRKRGVTHVYLCGLATDVCVAFSALHMAEAGFVTTVVMDGCAGVDRSQIEQRCALMVEGGVQLVYSRELRSLMASASLRDALVAASRIRLVKKQVLSVAYESGHAGRAKPSGKDVRQG